MWPACVAADLNIEPALTHCAYLKGLTVEQKQQLVFPPTYKQIFKLWFMEHISGQRSSGRRVADMQLQLYTRSPRNSFSLPKSPFRAQELLPFCVSTLQKQWTTDVLRALCGDVLDWRFPEKQEEALSDVKALNNFIKSAFEVLLKPSLDIVFLYMHVLLILDALWS